jgi:hypothetical protein
LPAVRRSHEPSPSASTTPNHLTALTFTVADIICLARG